MRDVSRKKSTANRKLQQYIDRLVRKHGTATALADKIGMSVSAFSRAVNEEGTFSFENCIRLADAFGDHPSVVLRLAGKGEMADILDRLYSRGGRSVKLSQRERERVDTWKRITPEHQNSLDDIVAALAAAAAVDIATGGKPRSRKVGSVFMSGAAHGRRRHRNNPGELTA